MIRPTTKHSAKRRLQRRGISSIIVIQMFFVSLIFAFMLINVANMQKQHATGQIASDLASRWGVDLVSRTNNKNTISAQVTEMARLNWHGMGNATLQNVTVETGSSRPTSSGIKFVKNANPMNSVRVSVNADVGMVGFTANTTSSMNVARKSTAVAIERDICVVIDRSGSMNFDLVTNNWIYDNSRQSFNPLSTSRYWYHRARAYQWYWYWSHPTRSRWSTMIPALYGLAEELEQTSQNELLSIVSYSTRTNFNWYDHRLRVRRYRNPVSAVEYQPSYNYQAAVKGFDDKYKTKQPVSGGTNISAGIDEGVKVLLGNRSRHNAFKTMIVMTDGQYNSGRHPSIAASDAADQGIEVFTVTFGSGADQNTMIQTAENGNGKHFHAPNGDALEEIFREIANIPPAAYID